MKYLCTHPKAVFHEWQDTLPLPPGQVTLPLKDCPEHAEPREAEGEDHRRKQEGRG